MNWHVSRSIIAVILTGTLMSAAVAQDQRQKQIDSIKTLLAGPLRSSDTTRGEALSSLGRLYMIRSDFVQAAQCFTESLEIAEKANDLRLAADEYRNISVLHFEEGDLAGSIAADQKALDILKNLHDPSLTAAALKSLGDTYLQKGDSSLAKHYYQLALPVFENLNDFREMAGLYANESILMHSDPAQTLALQLKAKALWEKYPVNNILPTVNVGNIGEYYLDLVRNNIWPTLPASDIIPHSRSGLLTLGEKYLRTAIQMGHANGDVQDSAYFTGLLAELEEQKGDFRNAYYHFHSYQGITDSIFSQEHKNQISTIENARTIDRKNHEIANKELQIANQHKKMWLLASCIALLAVTGGLVYRQARIRKKNNAELKRLNAELDEANKIKARFFGILSHDLRSPVARLVHLLQLQEMAPEMVTAGEAREQSSRIRGLAQNVLGTMETMLLWSKGQMERFWPEMAEVDVGERFAELQEVFPAQDSILFIFRDPGNLKVRTDHYYLRSIMHNLTANATKAVGGLPDARIEWSAWEESGAIHLSITDNGAGISHREQLAALFEERPIGGSNHGLGLHIIRDLAKAIGCRIEAQPMPDRGMRFVLSFSQTEAAIS